VAVGAAPKQATQGGALLCAWGNLSDVAYGLASSAGQRPAELAGAAGRSGPRFAPLRFLCLPVICLGPQKNPFGVPNSAPARAELAACSD
jgi:hypothetical protein